MMVWHYTIGEKVRGILSDGFIRTSTAGISPREIPVVWFSSNQIWEATANKAIMRDDGTHLLTTKQMRELFGDSMFRFGTTMMETLPWEQLQKAAKIPRKTQSHMIAAGKAVGSSKSDWFGVLDAKLIDGLLLQKWNDDHLRWEDCPFYKAEIPQEEGKS
jgi:hypothetical protein